jgi:hypothetical protein
MLTGTRATRLRLLVAAVAGVLVLAACGSSSSSDGGASGNAQSLLTQTFSGAHKVDSGVLNVALTFNPTGSSTLSGPISVGLSGPFQSRGTGKLPASDFTVSIGALGQHGSLGVISTGTTGYITLQGSAYQLPAADFSTLQSSFSSVASGSGGSSTGALSRLGIDPLHWLRNPSVVGTETVGGAATTHIRAGVNVAALLADIDTFLAKTAKTTAAAGKLPSSIPAASQQKIAAAVKNARVDVWTGQSDKTLRKLALSLTVPVTGQISTVLGGLTSTGVALTLQYAGLNQPQTITAPANVQPYSQFTAKLSGLLSAVQGSLGGAAGSSAGSGSTSTPSTGSGNATGISKYTKCLQQAGSDVTKMQKCASLLNGVG